VTGVGPLVMPADMHTRYGRICEGCWTAEDAKALDDECRARLFDIAGTVAQSRNGAL
jgi:hypothetical protein